MSNMAELDQKLQQVADEINTKYSSRFIYLRRFTENVTAEDRQFGYYFRQNKLQLLKTSFQFEP